MRLGLKLKIRDRFVRFPRTYRILRASYHGWRTFSDLVSVPIVSSNSSSDPKVLFKKKFATLIPIAVEPRLTVVAREFENSHVSLDVIIPVFNRGDLAARLISALQVQIEAVSKKIVVNLICADDCSEPNTSKMLESLCGQLGFSYVKREKNMGFVGNVNAAWEMSNSDFVLLLNSDVVVTAGYLERVLDPLIHDQKVGLSTNPTYGMLAHRIESGTNLNALNQYLFESSETQVSFVDACTAVGYSLAIRRAAIESTYLLDPGYGRGYGEDSDLHYRVVNSGYRSVWNLDNAVSHEGSASFNLTDSATEDRASGKARFFKKWGLRYFAEIHNYNLSLEESIDYRLSGFSTQGHVSTWIVLPTVKGNIGGIMVGCELAIEKSMKDSRTRLVTVDNSETTVVGDYMSVGRLAQLFDKKASGTVILVGSQSLVLLEDESWENSNLDFVYFCQGPDWLIDPSTLNIHRKLLPRISQVISVSEFMDSEILNFSSEMKITRYEPDFGYARYSGRSGTRKIIDFFFVHRLEHGKQGWLTVLLANFLSSTHSVVLASNERPYGLSKKVKHVSNVNRTAMLKLFAQTKVYIDTSIFEGFGLTPREAAFQDVKVVFMDVMDGRNTLREYTSHFSTLGFSPSIFEMADKAVKVLENPKCTGCNFCSS
jgi:GT2 family glycosyltransferase